MLRLPMLYAEENDREQSFQEKASRASHGTSSTHVAANTSNNVTPTSNAWLPFSVPSHKTKEAGTQTLECLGASGGDFDSGCLARVSEDQGDPSNGAMRPPGAGRRPAEPEPQHDEDRGCDAHCKLSFQPGLVETAADSAALFADSASLGAGLVWADSGEEEVAWEGGEIGGIVEMDWEAF